MDGEDVHTSSSLVFVQVTISSSRTTMHCWGTLKTCATRSLAAQSRAASQHVSQQHQAAASVVLSTPFFARSPPCARCHHAACKNRRGPLRSRLRNASPKSCTRSRSLLTRTGMKFGSRAASTCSWASSRLGLAPRRRRQRPRSRISRTVLRIATPSASPGASCYLSSCSLSPTTGPEWSSMTGWPPRPTRRPRCVT